MSRHAAWGLAITMLFSFTQPGLCQVTDPTDFALRAAYCLGSRIAAQRDADSWEKQACNGPGPTFPEICQAYRQDASTSRAELDHLKKYVIVIDMQPSSNQMGMIIATKQGETDEINIMRTDFANRSGCSKRPDTVSCNLQWLRTNYPALADASERIRNCVQIIKMLPF
jgi:hypothetical protein